MTDKLSDGPELGRLIKKLTGKLVKDQAYFGLQPFCSTCPAPAVSVLPAFPFCLLLLSQFTNSYTLFLLQLSDSFWKPALETEKGKGSVSAAAETVDDEESSEESSKEATAAGDDEDEESSPEAPVDDAVE